MTTLIEHVRGMWDFLFVESNIVCPAAKRISASLSSLENLISPNRVGARLECRLLHRFW